MQRLMQNLAYNFNNPELLRLALTHRSFGSQNNERLEFLGDALLSVFITEEIYQRFPGASEGQLTRMRAQLVCADMLTEIAKELGVSDNIVLGSGERRSGGHQRSSILADALEAIIGAIYIDSGKNIELLKATLNYIYAKRWQIFDDANTRSNKDPKTVLQELLQARKLELPIYEVVKIEGEQHEQIFHVECKVALLNAATVGVGNSRRKAEQVAAAAALELIQRAE